MSANLIIYLLFCHWIADFVFQSDWMATQKSKRTDALLLHSFCYGMTIGVLTQNPIAGVVLSLIHIPVDYVTSRINAKLWDKKEIHWFFVSLGFDQYIHFVTLILVFK